MSRMRHPPPTAAAARGRGMGILACSLFGAYWAVSTRSQWPTSLVVIGYTLIVLITATLVIAGIGLIRNARRVAVAPAPAAPPQRRTGWAFTLIFAAEIIALNIAAYLLAGHQLLQYLMPVIAIIVGLHFYPLAPLFRAPLYHITATLMLLAGIVGVILIANGAPANPTSAAVDTVCAITLWVTAFVTWRATRRPSRDASHAPTLPD